MSKKKKSKKAEPVVHQRRVSILKRKQDRLLKKKEKKERRQKHCLPKVSDEKKAEQQEQILKEEMKKKEAAKKKREKKKKKQEEGQKEERKRNLLEDNLEDERVIKRMEKQLGLKKRKSKQLPKSFMEDGWDYLLGVEGNVPCSEMLSDEEVMQTNDDQQSHSSDQSDMDSVENFPLESDQETDINEEVNEHDDFDGELVEPENENDESESDESERNSDAEEDEQNDAEVEEQNDADSNTDKHEDENDGVWEDIYGRTRAKDGSIINQEKNNDGKYIPPALRKKAGFEKKDLSRLKKQLKGNLNRLAESNMHTITKQIEAMYRDNSRNDMNEAIFNLITEAIVSPVLTPDRLVMEYAMLITILHANVGSEVGAYFIEEFNKMFFKLYSETDLDKHAGKELDNVILFISYILNFRVIDSKYIFELLAKLTESFKQKDVELILICLKNTGFVIRKSDPMAMKDFILRVQSKASASSSNDSRVQFMLEILLAVKNNNFTKIPNYDPSHFEHLKKILKSFIREGCLVYEMKIGLKDLEQADTLGRWWIVGSFYAGNLQGDTKTSDVAGEGKETSAEEQFSSKLLRLAKKMRMNTDSRKKIFCVVMKSEDYLDATENLVKLGTRNQIERDILFVLLDCTLQEKSYNPFYAHVAVKLSDINRKYKMANQFCIWDKIRQTSEMEDIQLKNLGNFVIHMITHNSQSIAVLRVIQFSELNKPNVRFLRHVICDILLNESEDTLINIFRAVTQNKEWSVFREALQLFLNHFIIKKKKALDPKLDFKKLEARVQLANLSLKTSSLKL